MALSPEARNQFLTPAILAVLVAVFLIGLTGLVISMIPFTMSEVPWRYQAAALVLGTGPQIAFLMMMIMFTAVHASEYGVVRLAAALCFVFAVVFIVILPFFALDFLSVRHLQTQAVLARFTREGLRLGATSLLLAVALIWAARRGWVAAAQDPESAKSAGHGLVVGQE